MDWILRHALVAAQLAVVVVCLLPGVGEELTAGFGVSAGFRQTQQMICGGGAWLLLGVLAAMLIAALWQRWRNAELVSSLLLAATVPCLVAGRFAGDLAVASALRWGLAGCFLVVSAAIWGRKRLLRVCRQARMSVDLDRSGSWIAHGVSLATTALPVLALTVVAAFCQFGGTKPGGPAVNTFFHRLGPSVSYLVPLAMVMLAMVGHALRESSAGYAFSAGLVAELAVTLGYSLSVVLAPRPFGICRVGHAHPTGDDHRRGVGAWLAGGAAMGQRVAGSGRPGRSARGTHRTAAPLHLMNVQLGMGIAGNAVLIVSALFALALLALGVARLDRSPPGMPLGWIALAGSVAAGAYRLAQQGRRLSANAVGLIGMTALGLLACTVRWVLPALGFGAESAVWGYRTLMLGWAIYALFIVLATWWVASWMPDGKGDSPICRNGTLRAASHKWTVPFFRVKPWSAPRPFGSAWRACWPCCWG